MDNYNYVIEELNAILVEGVYNSNLTLLETYHNFGTVLAQNETVYGDGFTKRVAKDLGKSQRTIQKCIQLAREYPDLQTLIDQHDKTLTWRKVSNQLLVEPKDKVESEVNYMPDIELSLRSNIEFLARTAQLTKDGLVFFLPNDLFLP